MDFCRPKRVERISEFFPLHFVSLENIIIIIIDRIIQIDGPIKWDELCIGKSIFFWMMICVETCNGWSFQKPLEYLHHSHWRVSTISCLHFEDKINCYSSNSSNIIAQYYRIFIHLTMNSESSVFYNRSETRSCLNWSKIKWPKLYNSTKDAVVGIQCIRRHALPFQ